MKGNVFNWMTEKWLGGVAFIYTMVVVFDLLVLPFYYENREITFSDDEMKIIMLMTSEEQIAFLKRRKNYVPITLDSGSIIHLAFGAVLTFGYREKNRSNTKTLLVTEANEQPKKEA